MKVIYLTQGYITWVSDKSFELYGHLKWHIINNGYAARSTYINGKRKVILLHRLIANTPEGKDTDHINHNTLDNQEDNLRLATTSQNLHNQNGHKDKIYSQKKGVSWHKRDKKWISKICLNYKQIYLGSFNSELEAAEAYQIAAKTYHGKFTFNQ